MTVTNSYPNPLDHFRSYSYQFIMTLSSTTEAFRSMIGTGDGSAPLFDIVNQAKTPGDELTMGNGQRAWLVMDTRDILILFASEPLRIITPASMSRRRMTHLS